MLFTDNPYDLELNGTVRLGITDRNTHTIYIHSNLQGDLLKKVLLHELTHALAGLLSGAQIKKFKVSRNKGSVTLTKNNIFITLAPYFVPIYPIIIIFVYFALAWFMDVVQIYSWFLFFSGIALAFYYALTFYAIKVGQEDMIIYGKFFSFIFVCFINIIMVVLILAWIFPSNIEINDFFVKVFNDCINFYKYIFIGVSKCWVLLKTK